LYKIAKKKKLKKKLKLKQAFKIAKFNKDQKTETTHVIFKTTKKSHRK